MADDAARILLGHISTAHGLRGEVVLISHAERPEDIAAYGPLSNEAGTRSFTILSVRKAGKGLVARIAEIADRNAAEALKGTGLYIERSRLPPPVEEEWYLSDLIGLTAVSPSGEDLGKVIAVRNFGAGDMLEIRPPEDGATDLIPFDRKFVPEVDLAAGRIVVDMPAGEGDGGTLE